MAALLRVHDRAGEVPEGHLLTISLFGLFAVALGFSYHALLRNPNFHMLPAIWASLVLMEFVISPVHDIVVGVFPITTLGTAPSLLRAIWACGLFVGGTWLGWAFARQRSAEQAYPIEAGSPVVISTRRATVIVGAFALVGAATQVYILASSGAHSGFFCLIKQTTGTFKATAR